MSISLADLMDATYPSGWSAWAPGGGTDIGPALTNGLTAIRSGTGRDEIEIPPGKWLLASSVSPDLLSGNAIVGIGSQASKIFYRQATGAAFYFSGSGGFTGGALKGLGIILDAGLGSSNAYAVLLRGDSQYQPDQMVMEDLYITSLDGSYWWEGMHCDGSARTSPQGVRIADMRMIEIFKCHNLGAYFSNCVGFSLTNFGTYVGVNSGNDVYIVGGTTEFSATRVNVGGNLNLDNCSKVYIEGTVGSLSASGSAGYRSVIQ